MLETITNINLSSGFFSKDNARPMKVYHGQANLGCLISSNGYLSTTENLAVAEMYSGTDGNQLSIIFEIEITEMASTNNIFAPISDYSQFTDEDEVLFDIGTVFKLKSFKPYKNQTWLVQLKLSNKEKDQADMYINYKMKELQHLSIPLRIGRILIEVGEYKQAKKYLKDLHNELNLNYDESLQQLLGMAEMHLNNYDESLKHLNKAYTACQFNSKGFTNLISDLCYFYTIENETSRKIFHSLSLSLHYSRFRHMYAVCQQLEIYSVCRVLERISQNYMKSDQPVLASQFHQCVMDFLQSILPSEHPQLKQPTDTMMSLSIDVNETIDSIICEYYLPITHKISRYIVEFENEITPLLIQPLETLHDMKLKIKNLYSNHNEIDCFVIDEKGIKVRYFICRTQASMIINIDPDAAIEHTSFQLNIYPNDRIEDLQDKIEEITKILFYHQILQYQEKDLFSYKLLSNYDIQDNSIIILKQDCPKNTTVYIDIISPDDDSFRFKRKLSLHRRTVFDLKKRFGKFVRNTIQ
ncbi:unnamed protein product [Adineta ricciae]|uniref:Ubiquitin-like domain-containing protein n=1 Tax=Adineta ricciae TaxID=249248 RepID=A0A815R6Z2_ADIRI|nr:unnamed protein product [Adineta ricciae]